MKEAVKETLVGSEEPVTVSIQSKARFNKYAVKDPVSGELFMGPAEFINAVAPADGDYVSAPSPLILILLKLLTQILWLTSSSLSQ